MKKLYLILITALLIAGYAFAGEYIIGDGPSGPQKTAEGFLEGEALYFTADAISFTADYLYF